MATATVPLAAEGAAAEGVAAVEAGAVGAGAAAAVAWAWVFAAGDGGELEHAAPSASIRAKGKRVKCL